ncbi:hypothetical protein BN131_1046 [Cronobacter malonaticus 681]|nr:hypothetical protein BN131_1046 [Cronobacter malonaticus 681]
MKSGSNISTPSKPACAMARSFSGRVPATHSVAIERSTASSFKRYKDLSVDANGAEGKKGV